MSMDIDRLEEIVNGLLNDNDKMRAEIAVLQGNVIGLKMKMDDMRDTLRDMAHANTARENRP